MKLNLNKKTIVNLSSDDLDADLVLSEEEQRNLAGGAQTWEYPPCQGYSLACGPVTASNPQGCM